MKTFLIFFTVIVFIVPFFFVGCAPLTKEQKAENELHSTVLSVIEKESKAGRVKIHRVMAKKPTDEAGKLIAEAIKLGYLSAGPKLERYRDGRYWVNKGSVPAIVTRYTLYPLIVENVRFTITDGPERVKIGSFESLSVGFKFTGELNEFGKFLQKGGAQVLPEGIGLIMMEKKEDGWHIS